jgi:hypothetical protein
MLSPRLGPSGFKRVQASKYSRHDKMARLPVAISARELYITTGGTFRTPTLIDVIDAIMEVGADRVLYSGKARQLFQLYHQQ